MPLKDYIQGKKHGKKANRIERKAMNDPFLQEALDGFENVAGDHAKIIDRLEKRFSRPAITPQKTGNILLQGSIAATILLLIGLAAYFLVNENISNPVANDIAAMETYDLSNLSENHVKAEYSDNAMLKEQEKRTIQSDSIQHAFGEKEFLIYCQQKANKNVCAGKDATAKVSFFIDETGKPSKIEYKKYSCEDAKKEIDALLSSSPVWTKTNRKVTMTIRW